MPWSKPEDALRHTKKADTPARQRQWLHVANSVLARTGDDQAAIMAANEVLDKHPSMKGAHPPKTRFVG